MSLPTLHRRVRPGLNLFPDVDRAFDQMWRSSLMPLSRLWPDDLVAPLSGRMPSGLGGVSVSRSENEATIQVEVPGVDPEDIDLSVSGRVLTVSVSSEDASGEVDASADDTEDTGSADEEVEIVGEPRARSVFRRSAVRRILLDEDLDTSEISASANLGVLTIHIPVLPTESPKKIPISS